MAYNVKVLPSARGEIAEIISYLKGCGSQPARSFSQKLRSQVDMIASGVVDYGLSHIPDLAELGYHSCRVNSYVMLYFYEGDELVVAHVFHQRQDYARLVEPAAGFSIVEDED